MISLWLFGFGILTLEAYLNSYTQFSNEIKILVKVWMLSFMLIVSDLYLSLFQSPIITHHRAEQQQQIYLVCVLTSYVNFKSTFKWCPNTNIIIIVSPIALLFQTIPFPA